MVAPKPEPPLDFESVYERWFDEVSAWMHALGAPEAHRDDLVQDVFVVVYRRLGDFDGQNIAGWLYRIARHRVRDFRRLAWVKHVFAGTPLLERMARAGRTPADDLETKQQSESLSQLLDKLNEEQRAAFFLFEIQGYTGEEIAEIQGVPLNTVWARIHRARLKLQDLLNRQNLRQNRGVGQ